MLSRRSELEFYLLFFSGFPKTAKGAEKYEPQSVCSAVVGHDS